MNTFKVALLVVAVLSIFALPFATYADTVLRVSETITIDTDQVVEGDFYGLSSSAGPISLSGTIEGDAYVIGGSVTANGTIDGDVLAVGGALQMHASVTDDVRAIAGEVTIAEHVEGDVFVFAGVLTILSSASIEGDIFFYGGKAEINGRVGGSVHGTAEDLRIDGAIAGSVDVTVVRSLVIGDRADIGGDIRYESENIIVRAQNAVVVGDIVQNSPRTPAVDPKGALVPLLVFAFTVLIVFAVGRSHIGHFMRSSREEFTKDGLVGIAGLIIAPVVVSVLFVSVIGFVVGVLVLLAVLFVYLISFVLSAIFAGLLIQKVVYKTEKMSLLWVLAGVLAVIVIVAIPVIGPVAILTLMSVTAGAILRSMYAVLVR